MTSDKVLGIDLGTTNSAMALVEDDEDAEIIINEEGERTTPSVVAFDEDDGTRIVGRPAKNQAVKNPDRTIESIKRHMGDGYTVEIDGEEYTPEEISAFTLQKIKRDAEEYLGEEVTDVVITVPAYFNDKQRQATKNAGEIAGFNVRRIINEPTAAALAYGIENDEDQRVLVYDLGGGTFDVSVLDIGMGVFEVIATNGDNDLGGDDWDQAIIDWVSNQFEEEHGMDLYEDSQALQRLQEAAEKAKIELSTKKETTINLPFITSIDGEPLHIERTLSRAKFESMTEELVERTAEPVEKALDEADMTTDEIDDVLLVGGSTRIPQVQEKVEEIVGKEPRKDVNPDEVVSLGAAVQGDVLDEENSDIVLVDVTPHSLGVKVKGGKFEPIIEQNTRIPTEEAKTFTTAKDNQTSVDIEVYQGEDEKVINNEFLGNFTLAGVPAAPAGAPRIDVTFEMDANGILNVKAVDEDTGSQESVKIEGGVGLDEEEVEEMKDKVEEEAEKEEQRRELVDVRNEAEKTLENARKKLENGVDGDEEERLNELIGSLEDAIEADEVDSIESTKEELKQEL